MSSPAPKSRQFRISLRTLFVVLTVFGVWLGWQVNIINARRTFRREAYCSTSCNMDIYPEPAGVPFYRRWLGDEDILRIDVLDSSQLQRAAELFPEARWIMVIPGPEYKLRHHSRPNQ